MGPMDLSKWAFLEDDDDEGQACFAEASELREQANALAHHAHGKEPSERQKSLREAVSMYCRAVELLKTSRLPASAPARELGLHCRLNAACLALEAASIPTPGAQGQKQAQQAEKTSERLALEALELDPKNPHAALLLARLSADQRAAWLALAKSWASERQDQEVQKQVKCLESKLYPKPETWGKEPSDWVRLGVQLLKQGKPAEANNLFLKTIDFLDQQEGGPIERLLARPLRALAFDALEGAAESLAAMNDFVAALENGRRAASLIQPTPGMQVPFPEPECSRRECLLNLSMGHAAEAMGAKDALRFFRLAAQALQRHGKDPALEGAAVLELGLRLVKECEEGDLESADLAVPALEHATSCLKTAQGRCSRRQSEAGQGSTEHVSQKLRWRELQAQVALCSVHQLRGDVADAQDGKSTFRVPNHLELMKKVGSGAYGCFASFKDKKTGDTMAVKKITNAFDDLVDGKRILREVKLLRQLDHDNIIRILDMYPPAGPDFEDIYIVTDLMETDLHRVIYSKQPLTEEHHQYFVHQVLRGLAYLHSASIVHRDIKPSNLLVNKNCDLKICDFGLARVLATESDEAAGRTDYVVTRWYRAPEVMLHSAEYTVAIDVWAVGCILCELINRKPLFAGKDHVDQIRKIISTLGTPTEAESLWLPEGGTARGFLAKCPAAPRVNWKQTLPTASENAIEVVSRMVTFDPTVRISVADTLRLKYFDHLFDEEDMVHDTCNKKIDWSFDNFEPTKPLLQSYVYCELASFHSEIVERDKDLLAARGIDKLLNAGKQPKADPPRSL